MKVSIASLGLVLAQLAHAAPTPTVELNARGQIVKRASVTDVPTVGFATLNGGTTGGKGGTTTTVSTLAQYTAAIAGDDPKIVVVEGTITGAVQARPGSNTSIIGKDGNAVLVGIGMYINKVSNVIVRNLSVQKVLAENGDAIGIQASTNVWVDHCDLSSDMDHDKDYYDGLLDITHASDYVTVSNTYFHDHWKGDLIGHSDSNGAEDTGHLRVTEYANYFARINSRTPSIRFGTGHFFDTYFEDVNDGINTRDGAQVLVESNVFEGSDKPLYSTDDGYAVSVDNDFGGGSDEALQGTLTSLPYSYTTLGSGNVKAAVVGVAGATLSF